MATNLLELAPCFLRHTCLGSEAVYEVLEENDQTVTVEVVRAPGLTAGMRVPPDGSRRPGDGAVGSRRRRAPRPALRPTAVVRQGRLQRSASRPPSAVAALCARTNSLLASVDRRQTSCRRGASVVDADPVDEHLGRECGSWTRAGRRHRVAGLLAWPAADCEVEDDRKARDSSKTQVEPPTRLPGVADA